MDKVNMFWTICMTSQKSGNGMLKKKSHQYRSVWYKYEIGKYIESHSMS